jgi:hypothetical protein
VRKQIVATVALALTLAGCADAGDGEAGAEQPDGASPTSAASTSPSPTAKDATGALLEQPDATVRAPEGFTHAPDVLASQDSAEDVTSLSQVHLSQKPGWRGAGLDEAASTSRDNKSFRTRPDRVDDIELDGVPAYHLTGRVDQSLTFDEFGALRHGQLFLVEFEFDSGVSESERREAIESSLATFEWR